jgi:hypothetical protein
MRYGIGAIFKALRSQAMFSKPFPKSDDRKTHGETRRIATGSSHRDLEYQ